MRTYLDRILVSTTLLVVFVPNVSAQDRWVVRCFYEKTLMGYNKIEECRPPDAERAAVTDVLFENATEWLLGLGFQAPVPGEHIEAWRGRFLAKAIMDTLLAQGHLSTDALASYQVYASPSPDPQAMWLAGWNFPSDMATPAHELFHTVQAAEVGGVERYHELSRVDASGCPDGEALSWILEGTAEAVAVASSPAAYPNENTPNYSKPLYDCEDKERAYEMAHFWLSVGTELSSRDRVEYLRGLFDPSPRDLKKDRGLTGVHEALTGRTNPDGLYELYPQVIALHANDKKFYEDEAQGLEVPEIALDFDPSVPDEATERGEVERVAARAYLVRVTVPEGELAGLTVELPEGPSNRDDPALHLIVDDTRYDRVDAPDEERNVFRKVITGTPDTLKFLVRLANIATSPAETGKHSYELRFALEPLEVCTGSVMMAALSGQITEAHRAVEGRPEFANIPNLGMLREETNPFTRWQTYEEQTRSVGLMPTQGELHISGVVGAGGAACTDHLGDNVGVDVELGLMTQESVREAITQKIMSMTQAERMEMMRGGAMAPDPLSGDVMERLLGFGMPPGATALMAEIEGSTILETYSPNGFSWILGMQPEPEMLRHGGIGGWPANSAAHIRIVLPGTPVSALREGQEYRAVTLAPGGSQMLMYADWVGEWQTARPRQSFCEAQPGGAWISVRRSTDRESPYPDAFSGMMTEVEGLLEGHITVRKVTGAAVEGTFELTGEGVRRQVSYEYDWVDSPSEACEYGATGVIIGNRIVDEDETRGPLSVSGTFQAPAAVVVGRQGRMIMTTRKVGGSR